LDGPEEVVFGGVSDVGRLPDGRLFVADEQASLIRFFSPAGDYTGSVGGEGDGPGDLNWFSSVDAYRGDSIWVYDYRTRRTSIFDANLRFARSVPNPLGATSNYWITHKLSGGRFLLFSPGTTIRDAPPGPFRDTTLLVVLEHDGSAADTIGRAPMRTRFIGADGRPELSHFSVSTGIAGAAERVLVLDPHSYVLREYDVAGNLRRVFSKSFDPQPISDEIRGAYGDAYAEWLVGSSENPPASIERDLREGIYPANVPASSSTLLVDELGYTWVGRYHFPGERPSTWDVFDHDGVWLGVVRTPDQLDVKEIGVGELIGVWSGDYDVQYLRSYALDRR
jgi:hypothetical protein